MARAEFATMLLAEKCGIRIPELRVVSSGNRGHEILLVKRFDRISVSGGFTRIPFLSALSLMQWDENDRLFWSYPSIADKMRSAFLADKTELQQLFRRMVYNILCRNTDDHPRNHAFIKAGENYRLSPAYDITPWLAKKGVITEFSLAMSIGNQGRSATAENALSYAGRFGLRTEEAEAIILEMQKIVSGLGCEPGRSRCHESVVFRAGSFYLTAFIM